MLNRFAMALVLAAGLTLAGCGSGTSESSTTGTTGTTASGGGAGKSGGKTYKVTVIPKGMSHEFWKTIHAGANDAAAEFGAEITFKGPANEGDRQAQIDIVDNTVSAGTDAIVLAPLDADGLKKPVDNAISKKIPVVIIDSALNGSGFASFVATDNEKGGAMAADEMIKRLNGKGKIVVLKYAIGSASTEAREKGFEDEIKAKGSGIQIVSDNQYAGDTADKAQKKSEDMLATLKGPDGKLTIDGIFCPNESSTVGMLATLRAHSWNGKVHFIGFDSSEKEVEGLKAGDIDATVVQNPYKIGYEGVHEAIKALKGEKNEARVDTGATLITKETMDSPENQKLLKPKQV